MDRVHTVRTKVNDKINYKQKKTHKDKHKKSGLFISRVSVWLTRDERIGVIKQKHQTQKFAKAIVIVFSRRKFVFFFSKQNVSLLNEYTTTSTNTHSPIDNCREKKATFNRALIKD